MPPNYSRRIRRVPTTRRRYGRKTKRRTYRRKPTYRRRRPTYRRSSGLSSLKTILMRRRMEIVKNPFSMAVSNPKYPDTRANYSAGQRLQVSGEIQQADGPVIYCVLYPGVGGGLTFVRPNSENQEGNFSMNNYKFFHHMNHIQPVVESQTFKGGEDGIATYTSLTVKEDSIDKWRMVSQGLRLSLVNNTEENDGWFEYIRVPVDIRTSDWAWASNSDPDIRAGSLIPRPDSIKGLTTNMVDHVTYQSGKLRDIHRYAFILQNAGEDHEFRSISGEYGQVFGTEISTSGPDAPVGNTIYQLNATAAGSMMVRDFIDTSYGMIILKIHGNSSIGSATGTKLMFHMVSNHELIYDNKSPLSRFHTRAVEI